MVQMIVNFSFLAMIPKILPIAALENFSLLTVISIFGCSDPTFLLFAQKWNKLMLRRKIFLLDKIPQSMLLSRKICHFRLIFWVCRVNLRSLSFWTPLCHYIWKGILGPRSYECAWTCLAGKFVIMVNFSWY